MRMKRLLSAAAFLLFASVATTSAQTLSESFEGTTIPPEGWTTKSSCTKYAWTATKYSTISTYFIKGYNNGGQQAMASTTGKTKESSSLYSPDSWLITPQVTIGDGDYLNFMISWNASFNNAASVTESGRTHFEVLVSTTDTASASFTDTLYQVVPKDLAHWHAMSLDLSKYAGKQVYIAFRDHGNTPGSPSMTNMVFIDDVKINKTSTADLVVEKLESPVSGFYNSQNVTMTVKNYGAEVSAFTIGYKIDDNAEVTEAVNQKIEANGSATLSFSAPATMSRDKHTILTWATADNDVLHDNDTLTSSVSIDKTMPFPYEMTSENIATDWKSTVSRMVLKVMRGWSYSETEEAWGYVQYDGKKSRLQSSWIEVPDGPKQLKFDYQSLVDANVTMVFTNVEGDTAAVYKQALATASELATAQFAIDVPAGGYKISIGIDEDYTGQFVLKNLVFKTLQPNDVAVRYIEDPFLESMVEGTKMTFAAQVSNEGSKAQSNIPVKLVYDGETVATETIDATLQPDEVTLHTFNFTTTATAGQHNVEMIVALEGDTNAANDTLCDAIDVYKPYTIPFVENFEDDSESIERWFTTDPADGVIEGSIGSVNKGYVNYAKDGNNAAYINTMANTEHDNWFTSPAINIEKAGPIRLSYYYTTTKTSTNADDETYLDAYLVKGDSFYDVDSYTDDDKLTTDTITDDNVLTYRQGYAFKNVTEPGIYYLSLHNTGMGHDLIIDDVRLDTESDLAVTSASQTAESGFGLTTDTISVTLANHGASEVKSVELKYYVNDELAATETYAPATAMQPGETTVYMFDKKLDVSAPGKYTIKVEASAEGDTLTFNNSWTLAAISSYETATLPYSDDLESEESQAYWYVSGNWTKKNNMSSSSSAYNGTGGIQHVGKTTNAEGDWAVSGCIDIPAGAHELSFFYRTSLNGKTAKSYGQNFQVYLACQKDTGFVMNLVYTSPADVVAYENRYKKVIVPFDLEAGKYYIGIKCTSTNFGNLFMDQFAINDPTTTGKELGEYTADFSEWYQYDQSKLFEQWTASETGALTTKRSIHKVLAASNLPGVFVSPAFIGKAGDKIEAALSYSMAFDKSSQLTDEEKAKMKMSLVVAQENIPDSFSTVILTGTDTTGVKATATETYTLPADGIYYYGVKVEGAANSIKEDVVATYNLYDVTLKANTMTGISNTNAATTAVEVYTIDGLCLGKFNDINEARKSLNKSGLYIVKNGTMTLKTTIRK